MVGGVIGDEKISVHRSMDLVVLINLMSESASGTFSTSSSSLFTVLSQFFANSDYVCKRLSGYN